MGIAGETMVSAGKALTGSATLVDGQDLINAPAMV